LIAHEPAAVLFDFGGTLDADGLPWKERVYRLFLEAGAPAAREQFDPSFYKADDALVGAIPATTSFEETVARLTAGVADALGLADTRIADAVARRFIGDSLANIAGNIPLLRELGRRYRLGVVSNFYGNLARVCDDAGIQSFFQVFVDSTDVGCLKPDPRIFQRALEALDVPASAATFVGDSLPRDMAGARGVGMRHIWLAGAEPSADGPCCRGDVQIKSLRELEAILL
jgi:HAD superfamily hydrolase (TIGR01549 family)